MTSYPIYEVTKQMVLQDEQLGTKDKFWCRFGKGSFEEKWLFKFPRPELGKAEHLAEKIANEVAKVMEVPCAEIELATFEGRRGTISRNLVPSRHSLVHGNEIIAGRVTGYDPHRKRRTSEHTWERIAEAIQAVCGPHACSDLKLFAGYLTLDALVGNTDRHHENWAFLRRERAGRVQLRLAPSFDHASSLGRELKDACRQLRLQRGQIEREYIRKGAGGVYLADFGERKVPPLELVEVLAPKHPELFGCWLRRVPLVTEASLRVIIEQMPGDWMTPLQAAFAKEVIQAAQSALLQIARP